MCGVVWCGAVRCGCAVEPAYGVNGTRYVAWNGALADSQHTDTPWIMCQQSDAPKDIINTCNGFYCDNWLSDHFKSRSLPLLLTLPFFSADEAVWCGVVWCGGVW